MTGVSVEQPVPGVEVRLTDEGFVALVLSDGEAETSVGMTLDAADDLVRTLQSFVSKGRTGAGA